MTTENSIYKFTIWYLEPIRKLEELPNGNGGWVAFIVGIALYERLIDARLKINNLKRDKESKYKAMSSDLGLTDKEVSIFWDTCRNGLLHQAMPKLGKTGLFFRDDFSGKPVFKEFEGQINICINPWKFTHKVLDDFMSQPELISASDSFPLASIIYQKDNETKFIV